MIVGERVTNKPNDKQELVPDVNTIPQNIRKVSRVIADSGFYSENAIMKLESEKNAISQYLSIPDNSTVFFTLQAA